MIKVLYSLGLLAFAAFMVLFWRRTEWERRNRCLLWLAIISMSMSMFHEFYKEFAQALSATNIAVLALLIRGIEREDEVPKPVDIKELDDFTNDK